MLTFLQHPDGPGGGMLYRIPRRGEVQVQTDACCVVEKTQAAIVFSGERTEVLGPGRHRLGESILGTQPPISGAESGHPAAVCFVSRRVFSGIAWELDPPVPVIDGRGRTIPVKATGTLAVRVSDPLRFASAYRKSRRVCDADTVRDWVRERATDTLSVLLRERFRGVDELQLAFDRVASESRLSIQHSMENIGVDIIDFFLLRLGRADAPMVLRRPAPIPRNRSGLGSGDATGSRPNVKITPAFDRRRKKN